MNSCWKFVVAIVLFEPFFATAETRLQNIANRGFIGVGDNVLIGGLVISGSEPKTGIIRARGPALAQAGVTGGEGIGIIEVYELEDAGETRLINIVTRGFIGTGNSVLIGGVVISGTDTQTQ